MGFKIPRTFQLAGRTWRVRYKRMRKQYGLCQWKPGVIWLDKGLDPDFEMQTFFHELLHAIAWTAGRPKINDNEDLIDSLAALLAQMVTTTSYEKSK